MINYEKYINIHDKTYQLSLLFIVLSPLYWNIIGRLEYHTKIISKIIGSPLNAIYLFGMSIFLLSGCRDWIFEKAIQAQPKFPPLKQELFYFLGIASLIIGLILVLASFYQLGFINTFLGDYFGFLLDHKINAFPFSIVNNPMYWGSFLNFLGTSLIQSSLAGISLSLWVWIVYRIAICFEEPFTEYIYSQALTQTKKRNKTKNGLSASKSVQNGVHSLDQQNGYHKKSLKTN